MDSLADYEVIGPEERLRRIGLLGKAAILALARRDAEEARADTNHSATGNSDEPGEQHPLTAEELDFFIISIIGSSHLWVEEAGKWLARGNFQPLDLTGS